MKNLYIKGILVGLGVVTCAFAEPSLTIYNGGFAVVRDQVELDLKRGDNRVTYSNATAHLEPQSVVLRDPSGDWDLSILEQNYRADPLSQGLLLSLFEGKQITFEKIVGDNIELIEGTVIRSGYQPHFSAYNRYGQSYQARQQILVHGGGGSPIIEVDGQLHFRLPGTPIFPSLGDDTILKPTLEWLIDSDRRGKLDAELSYVTAGMSWLADYNIIAPEKSDTVDFVGWITMDNQTGRSFENARIKLMAGDVKKVADPTVYAADAIYELSPFSVRSEAAPVVEKAFDDFHLYTLNRNATLRDRETKQVEFIRASGVKAKRIYVYDGAYIPMNRYRGWNRESIRQDESFGTQSNPKVWIMQEIENTEENGLGIPLPKGKTRFYRQDAEDGQLEFTGENVIDHTPKKELLRINTGNAFDIIGDRNRTDYRVDHRAHWIEEAFEITVTNRKEEAVTVRVTEHLYRWDNWELLSRSDEYEKVDSDTIVFNVEIPADAEKTIAYRVKYTW